MCLTIIIVVIYNNFPLFKKFLDIYKSDNTYNYYLNNPGIYNPSLNDEKNPEIIICSKKQNVLERMKRTEGYRELSAVKNGKVYKIDNDKIDRQSCRVIDGLYDMAKIIHPELF